MFSRSGGRIGRCSALRAITAGILATWITACEDDSSSPGPRGDATGNDQDAAPRHLPGVGLEPTPESDINRGPIPRRREDEVRDTLGELQDYFLGGAGSTSVPPRDPPDAEAGDAASDASGDSGTDGAP